MNRILGTLLLALAFLLVACDGQGGSDEPTAAPTAVVPTSAAPTVVAPTPTPTERPTPEPAPTTEPGPTEAPPIDFEPATFRSDPWGFEFDYPADWIVSDQAAIGDRGSATQFLVSAEGDAEVAMQMTIYLWDPKYDLEAYVEQRKTAWMASGTTVISEEERTLDGDHQAVRFIVRTQEGEQAFFFFTTIADRYLELSGDQRLELLGQIAGTMRLFEPVASSEAAAALGCLTVTDAGRSAEWVACNVMDAIRSRNLQGGLGYMANPFAIGYWGSEGRSATPEEAAAELLNDRLPRDAAMPMTFTIDREQFPPLQGSSVDGLFGPDVNVVYVIYSEGWGRDGQGAALIYIAQDAAGDYYWHGLVYSFEHFDK